MGSNVVSGTAIAVVLKTGSQTYFGSIAKSIVGQRVLTSFDKGINRFTWLMLRFMLVMVLWFSHQRDHERKLDRSFHVRRGGRRRTDPEMLPMIVTVNLAKGAISMARKKVIVKRLNSIQNFGAMDILCTDKTGTLTQDKVVLEKYVDVFGDKSDRRAQIRLYQQLLPDGPEKSSRYRVSSSTTSWWASSRSKESPCEDRRDPV